MTTATGTILPRRAAATGRFSVSVVSVEVPGPGLRGGTDARLEVALLRRARALGVTGFDLSRSDAPLLSARQLRDALPADDAEAVTFVGLPPPSLPAPGPRGPRDRPDPVGTLDAIHDALGRERRIVVLLDPTTSPEVTEELDRRRRAGELLDLVRPLDVSAPGGIASDTGLRSTVLSLLRPEAAGVLAALPPNTPPFVLGFDPFAGGALDGSRMARAPVELGPRSAPSAVRELESSFAPVLQLGFLSRPGRPLHRAALDFVLGWPSVLTTVIPLPSPERIDAVLDVRASVPLTPSELARLGIGPSPPARG